MGNCTDVVEHELSLACSKRFTSCSYKKSRETLSVSLNEFPVALS